MTLRVLQVALLALAAVAIAAAELQVVAVDQIHSDDFQVNISGVPYAICAESLTLPQLLARLRALKAEMERDGTLMLLGYIDDDGDARALTAADLERGQ